MIFTDEYANKQWHHYRGNSDNGTMPTSHMQCPQMANSFI